MVECTEGRYNGLCPRENFAETGSHIVMQTATAQQYRSSDRYQFMRALLPGLNQSKPRVQARQNPIQFVAAYCLAAETDLSSPAIGPPPHSADHTRRNRPARSERSRGSSICTSCRSMTIGANRAWLIW